MAKIKTKARSKKKKVVERELPFSRQNYIIFAVGVLLILIGYLALAQGPYDSFSSMSIAPVLLVIGYCIVIPLQSCFGESRQLLMKQKLNRAISSAGSERLPYKQEVTGSNPVSPIKFGAVV